MTSLSLSGSAWKSYELWELPTLSLWFYLRPFVGDTAHGAEINQRPLFKGVICSKHWNLKLGSNNPKP